MSISYVSYMMIGNNYNNIAEHLQPVPALYNDDITEYMESLGLTYASPWLNAEQQFWFVGLYIPDTPLTELDWIRWVAIVEEKHNKLREIVGPDLKIELKAVLDVW